MFLCGSRSSMHTCSECSRFGTRHQMASRLPVAERQQRMQTIELWEAQELGSTLALVQVLRYGMSFVFVLHDHAARA